MSMKIGELKTIVDAIHDLHGPDARTSFHYQKASGRIGVGGITSYNVSVGSVKFVTFRIEYARGVVEADE